MKSRGQQQQPRTEIKPSPVVHTQSYIESQLASALRKMEELRAALQAKNTEIPMDIVEKMKQD